MLPILKENKIMNMFKKINILMSIINDIVILDNDTVGITFDKNIVFYNNRNIINISRGYYVTIGSQIHNNPKISLTDFYKNPSNVQQQIDESVQKENFKLAEEQKNICQIKHE